VPHGVIKSNKRIKYTKLQASKARYTLSTQQIRQNTTKVRQG